MSKENLKELLEKYPELRKKLASYLGSYGRKRQLKVVTNNLLRSLTFLITIIILFLLAERTPVQSEFTRFIFNLVFYVSLCFWVLYTLKSLFVPPTVTGLAIELERLTGKYSSAVSTAAEFEEDSSNYPGTSEILRKLTVADAANKIENDDIKIALKTFSKRFLLATFIFVVFISALWNHLSPMEFAIGLKRVVYPMQAIAPYSSLTLAIKPGNALVPKGDDLQISAVLNRKSDEIPVMTIFAPDSFKGTAVEMYPDKTATESKYIYTLSEMQEGLDYQISCEKRISDRFSVRVIPRPEIKSIKVTLHQPAYIATSPTTLAEGVGDCSVLKGSKVEIKVVASQNIASAAIYMVPGATQSCDVTFNKEFKHVIDIATDTEYSIFMENSIGLRNENPIRYKVSALVDATPTVELLQPGKDIPFPTSKRLNLKAVAKDDFGIRAMILYYRVGNRKDAIPKNLKFDMTPQTEFQVSYPWMLDTLGLRPGTKISYYIEVDDSCKPLANVASTTEYHISMPSMYDMYRGEEKQHQSIAERLEEYVKAQKLRQESLTKAYEQIKHEKKLDYETEKLIENAIKRGKKQQQTSDEILKNFEKLKNRMEENPLSTPEALEKMQKVNELLNDVLDDEAKKLMNELQKSLKDIKLDPKELEKYQNAFKMKDYLKGLDRTINLLKQVKEQRKLNAFGNEIEDLLKRQKEIASQTENINKKIKNGKSTKEEESKLKDLVDQQNKIKKELEQLQKQANEIIKKDKNKLSQNPLTEDIKNIKDKMKQHDFKKMSDEISKELSKKNTEKARQHQQNMLEFLKSLSKNAKKICRYCSGGASPQLDLSRFVRKALEVSINQEMLYKQIQHFPPKFMRGKRPEIEGIINNVSILQVQVKLEANKLENALETYVRSSFSVDPSILDAIRGNQPMLSNIVKNLEDRSLLKARSDQNEIIRKFNKLAMDLMRKQDQGNQGSSSNPMSGMQQFKNLTRRQLSLYQKMMNNQSSPADQQMIQQLKQMAMEQRQIREALEKLLRESRLQKNTRGRLEDILNDMKDLETKILDPNLRREVAERQKKIYERMLRAQKAIKDRKKESEERQAISAREQLKQVEGKPLPKIASDSRKLSKDFLTDMREEYPKSYKKLLQDYFKSLNIYGENE